MSTLYCANQFYRFFNYFFFYVNHGRMTYFEIFLNFFGLYVNKDKENILI